jgi:hypothetical protein
MERLVGSKMNGTTCSASQFDCPGSVSIIDSRSIKENL